MNGNKIKLCSNILLIFNMVETQGAGPPAREKGEQSQRWRGNGCALPGDRCSC